MPIDIDQITCARCRGYRVGVARILDDGRAIVGTNAGELGELLKLKMIDYGVWEGPIHLDQLDAIWTTPRGLHETQDIRILKGSLFVSAEDFKPRIDPYFIPNRIENGTFAHYLGKLYRAVSTGNPYVVRLMSNNLESQQDGLIMEYPGNFQKEVPPDQIDYAYESKTFCRYREVEFIVTESDGANRILIEPSVSPSYAPAFVDQEFEHNGNIRRKWIDIDLTSSIWTKTTASVYDRYQNADRVLFPRN